MLDTWMDAMLGGQELLPHTPPASVGGADDEDDQAHMIKFEMLDDEGFNHHPMLKQEPSFGQPAAAPARVVARKAPRGHPRPRSSPAAKPAARKAPRARPRQQPAPAAKPRGGHVSKYTPKEQALLCMVPQAVLRGESGEYRAHKALVAHRLSPGQKLLLSQLRRRERATVYTSKKRAANKSMHARAMEDRDMYRSRNTVLEAENASLRRELEQMQRTAADQAAAYM